ncbi:RagB/SusD family nutrient uptake outer membrane protein [Sphingobacterium hotanense]|uniref:RagB/SusD family nutrient uptake outer membrane protein n=1 Tax=Sphingobacterium hotanense TaxID=649196 RepID=UPI0021A409BE|nr:RagB/SusD family nutrient uptake outer membrane protein [Sphingobacterium hotanense]MCT1526043.1 RagB/SusD family nutrient uptake outer membrane protein [Sphingobacterium hotanense]
MKKIILIILTAVCVSSCNKIDLLPISEKSVDGFYNNEKELNQALIGSYNRLQNLYVNSQYSYGLYESRSDNTWQLTIAYPDGEVSQFNVQPSNSHLSSAWNAFYNQIMNVNKVIESLQNIEMASELKNQYEAEARFLRALCYFDLVRLFGGVPKVATTLTIDQGYELQRATEKEIYDFIVEDLSYAKNNLPEEYPSNNRGRVTNYAAAGYLGKVYLYRSGYPLKLNEFSQAKAEFEFVINSDKFEFFQNYADIYEQSKEGGRQQLFSVQFVYSLGGNQFPGRNAPNTISKIPIAQGGFPFLGSPFQLFVSKEFVNSFEAGDLRKNVAIRTSWINNGNAKITNDPFCQKYQNGPVLAGSNSWDVDWIMLSYTDVLLMYAETLNEIGYNANGQAFEILNRIRQRAGLSAKNGSDVSSQTSFRLWVENERRFELCFENHRWFDLVRTDRAFEVMKTFLANYNMADNFKSRDQYLFPIPKTVIDVNPKITQNPGYN